MASVLFDLDGVLADSRASILSAHVGALRELGRPVPAEERLAGFIGPPLRLAYAELFGTPPDTPEIDAAVAAYRTRYRHTLRETTGFAGTAEALAVLEEAGLRLGICTSKPLPYAEPVLDVLGVRGFFAVVEGPPLDGTEPKTVTLGRALAALPDTYALVGDRSHDVVAAHDHGLLAVGALWGFGGREELEAAGADVLVAAPGQLASALLARRPSTTRMTGP